MEDNYACADAVIIAQIRAGESRLFDVLVEKYQTKLMQLAICFVKEPHEAKDICQETFLKAYQGLHYFRSESSFYTWLYRICVNTAKNHLKSQGYQLVRCSPLDDLTEDLASNAMLAYSPETHALCVEASENCDEILGKMPQDLQLSFIFREVQGLSYEEIARIMDCPVGTVRSRIHRARRFFSESAK